VSISNIKGGGKTIVILGIDRMGLMLGKILTNFSNSVSIWDRDRSDALQQKPEANVFATLEDIDNYPFETVDYIVLSQKLFSEEGSFPKHLREKIEKLEDRVFLDIEIIRTIFYKNRFIAIAGDGHGDVVSAALGCIFENTPFQTWYLSSSRGAVMLASEMDGGIVEGAPDLERDNIFVVDLDEQRIRYLKNMDFDIVAIFNSESKNHGVRANEKFLAKQAVNGISIVNGDDNVLRELWNGPLSNDGTIVLVPLSLEKMVENGYSYVNETIYNYYDSNLSYDLTNDGLIKTAMNKLSVLASFIAAIKFGLDPSTAAASLRLFRGVMGKMECLGRRNNILFINNACANSRGSMESPLEIYSNVCIIFVTNGRTGEETIQIKNFRDNIKFSLFLDMFEVMDLGTGEFNGLEVGRLKDIREAVVLALEMIEKRKNEKMEEEEFVLLLSPFSIEEMNNIYYLPHAEEFRRIVKNL
jgi:UDP-N-acetylmuramoylalanine-D-glutamate ligase